MKSLITLLVLCTTFIGFSQNPIEAQLDDFNTIKVYDLITVNLVKSTSNKIVITGLDASDVEFVYKKGTLKVRMAFDKQFDGVDALVNVYYTDLQTIDGNEGANITSNELIEQAQLEIRVQEGARVKAGVKVEYLEIKAVSGGITEISGTVDQQIVTVNTGGIVENRALKSKRSTIKVRAGGEVDAYATDAVTVNVQAGGDVVVYGNPKKVSQKSFAGGSIMIK